MFVCQLSGSVPTEAVVTPDGAIYEKRLILKHLEQTPVDPSNGKPLKASDLIDIQCPPVHKPSGAVSEGDISSLTRALVDKYDALMVECQQLRKERDEARHQVTHLMYLRDGATRVVAKQLEEINFLKAELQTLKTEERPHKQAKLATTDAVMEQVSTLATNLMQNRKQRKIVARTFDMFKSYKHCEASFTLPQPPLCIKSVLPAFVDDKSRRVPGLLALGHPDASVSLRYFHRQQPAAVLTGHQGPVTALASLFYPSIGDLSDVTLAFLNSSSSNSAPFESCLNIFSGSEDGTVRHWRDSSLSALDLLDWIAEPDRTASLNTGKAIVASKAPESFAISCQNVYRPNINAIVSLALHPIGTLLAAAGQSNKWSLLDLLAAKELKQFTTASEPETALCKHLAFQPDGNLVMGCLTSKKLPVWDIRTGYVESMPNLDIAGELTSITFSEIGYILALASNEGVLQIWDMRKPSVMQSVDVGSPISHCAFDYSGRHICVSTKKGVTLFSTVEKKKYDVVASWEKSAGTLSSAFDHRTDDYILNLHDDGVVDMYHAY